MSDPVPVPPPEKLTGYLVQPISSALLHALFHERANALGTATAHAMEQPGIAFGVFLLECCAVAPKPGQKIVRRKTPPPVLTAEAPNAPAQPSGQSQPPPCAASTRALFAALFAYLDHPPPEADSSLNTAQTLLKTLYKENHVKEE